MSQTDYPLSMSRGIAGQLSDVGVSQKDSKRNDFAAEVPFGVVAVLGSDDDSFTLPSASADKSKILGITVHTHARNTMDGAGVAIGDGARATLLSRGRCYVAVEEAVEIGDPVYMRFDDEGSETQLGSLRKTPDGVAEVRTVTPTAVIDTQYQLTVTVDGTDYVFTITSAHVTTATLICGQFRTAMAADSAFTALVHATGTATLILTAQRDGFPFTPVSTGTGTLAIVTTTPAAPSAVLLKGLRWTRDSSDGIAEVEIDALVSRMS